MLLWVPCQVIAWTLGSMALVSGQAGAQCEGLMNLSLLSASTGCAEAEDFHTWT